MPRKCLETKSTHKEFQDNLFLKRIDELDKELRKSFSNSLIVDNSLTRKIVSFQANKIRPYYKWYKYKEAFSADLVEYLFSKYAIKKGKILDPFAGSGTALFACSSLGYSCEGIELLPIGQKIIEANVIARYIPKKKAVSDLQRWLLQQPWNKKGKAKKFEILRITNGAYSQETHDKIGRYLNDLENESIETAQILLLALLCILESISYTRKDGQYLRWDRRAGRRNGKSNFDKGKIIPFNEAILKKLNEFKDDICLDNDSQNLLSLLTENTEAGNVGLFKGSCLDILPKLKDESYSGIITSPPYCNRYDYTRTYALEHAILGINEQELVSLRQAMLSCTVENKAKELIKLNQEWQLAVDICDSLPLLQHILTFLDYKREKKELNNNGISRMVRGYFYEMACVIQECYRVMEKDSLMFVVNDNVRYAGAAISVDMILSKIAQDIGFQIRSILVLPQAKGNSSQQMGEHGREALRKCIYVWKKNK